MSDPENFLSRWSRRKREASRGGTALPRPPDPPPQPSPSRNRVYADFGRSTKPGFDGGKGEAVARPVPVPTSLPFDPESLPQIQSITAETDIRGFLGSGVPAELTRAALRRAWACDPKIKNFVGLAEYDWDFNAANAVAGFGPLQVTDEVERMAAQIVPGSEPETCNLLDSAPTPSKAEQIAGETDTTRTATADMPDQAKHRNAPVNEIDTPLHPNDLTHDGPVAGRYTAIRPDNRKAFVRRQHGGPYQSSRGAVGCGY